MSDRTDEFGNLAQKLARNPLGIIALFIVLVYGLASLVTTFGSRLSPAEKIPLIYFLVGFPVLVLAAFTWLVSNHSSKLFAPSDFRDEENYVRTLTAAASLAIASVGPGRPASDAEIAGVVASVHGSVRTKIDDRLPGHGHMLWVDDRPVNNINERRAFEAMGIRVTLALSTDEAIQAMSTRRFAVVVSDMGRVEGPREGYVLLDKVRSGGDDTPFFIYASSNAPDHKREAAERGAQGCTNSPQELFQMVMRAALSR